MFADSAVSLARGWREAIAAAPEWRPPTVPTLVVVPHPDDESLSTGGLLAHLRRRSVPVVVAAVTDGDAAYPGVVVPARLASIRRAEQQVALARLGVCTASIVRLGIADGEVHRHESELEEHLVTIVARHHVEHMVAPWTSDHHRDHEACGRAAQGAAGRCSIPVTFGLFWGYQHVADPVFTPARLVRLPLDDADADAKRTAIGCHDSQIAAGVAPAPMLTPEDLAPAAWPAEMFVVDDEPAPS